MTALADPGTILASAPIRPRQVVAIALCVLLTALDGFDVLAISFASPGIAAEWGIDRAVLGVVLSMELVGMGAGSIALGSLADRVGRRPVALGCLVVMAAGMALSTTASGVTALSAYRFFTGVGIGGLLATTNAMAAEFSNVRRRSLAVTLMATGYPVGAIVGGSIVSPLLVGGEWRLVFAFGAMAAVTLLPLAWLLLPETVAYLVHRRPANALPRINAVLRRLGHEPVTELPAPTADVPQATLGRLYAPGLARATVLLTIANFAHIMTFYFVLKWIPKIVVDMGFAPSAAGGVLVWANVGGATGALLLGALTQRFGVRPLVIGALALSAVMVTTFGQTDADLGLGRLALMAGLAGMCTNAAVVGLYAVFAQTFPTAVRAGGTGLVIGVGRGGAALGPIVAGVLFAAGGSLGVVALVMSVGSVIAAAAVGLLREPARHETA